MTAYDKTFTMVSGGITVTWNARPVEVKRTRQAMIGSHQIPGSNQTALQPMGHGGYRIEFECDVYSEKNSQDHAIIMTNYNDARDIVSQLENWWTAGTTIVYRDDYVYWKGTSTINVKILELDITEVSGHSHSYHIRLVLQEFATGNAIPVP